MGVGMYDVTGKMGTEGDHSGTVHAMNNAVPSHYFTQAKRLADTVAAADTAVRNGLPADQWLSQLFKRNRSYGSHTRRLLADTVFSFFRWRGWIMPAGEQPDHTRALIEAHWLDAPAFNPIIAHLAEGRSSPLLSAPSMASKPLPEKRRAFSERVRPVLLKQLVPSWLFRHLAPPGDEEYDAFALKCIAAFQLRPPTWLRVHPAHQDKALRSFAAQGYAVAPHPILPGCLSSDRPLSREHLRLPGGQHPVIQDIASQCVGQVCRPKSGEHWWDMCAGSGGKALHLLDLMKRQGVVLATERRDATCAALQRRAKEQRIGTDRLQVKHTDAQAHCPRTQPDGILVDAPCSGVGTWSRNPDARWRITEADIERHVAVQDCLLRHAAAQLKPGGCLIYSVCTLTAAETVERAKALTDNESGLVPSPFPHPLTGHTTNGTCWIYPWDGPGSAMFMARWQKPTAS